MAYSYQDWVGVAVHQAFAQIDMVHEQMGQPNSSAEFHDDAARAFAFEHAERQLAARKVLD